MSTTPIATYLTELERQLRRRRAPHARLLREVEDHLRESAAALVAAGAPEVDADTEAVRRFGAAAAVATRFAEATASTTAHRAVNLAGGAYLVYLVVFAFFATSAASTVRDFPQGAPSFFAVQFAGVALATAFVRSLRWRRSVSVPRDELAFLGRALSLGVAALLIGAAAEAVLALTRPAGIVVWVDARWLTLTFCGAAAVIALAAMRTATAAAQNAAVGARSSSAATSDRGGATMLLGDVVALTHRLPLPRFSLQALHPVAHPWRVTSLLAAVASVAVSGAQLIAENAPNHTSTLVGAAALGLLEALAIVTGFAVFGRRLGLRDPLRPVG